MCVTCNAQAPHKPADRRLVFGDFRDDAAWKATEFTQDAYLAETPALHVSPQSQIPGWNIYTNLRGDMHNLMVNGFAGDIIASCIADALMQGLLGTDLPDNVVLKFLFAEFLDWCKAKKIPPPKCLTFSMRGLGLAESRRGYPELSSKYKGVAVKQILFFIAFKMERLCVHDRHSMPRATCACSLAAYVHICDVQPLVMSHEAAKKASDLFKLCLRAYGALCVEAHAADRHLFKVRPKAHYFDHTGRALLEFRINPRAYSIWLQEDMLGKLKRIGRVCHASTVSLRIVQWYLVYIDIRWWKRLKRRQQTASQIIRESDNSTVR